MIEITHGLTSVTAGMDQIPWTTGHVDPAPQPRVPPAATGARVTVEFQRSEALAPRSTVRVLYEFESGGLREVVGVPQPIRTVVRWGRDVVYHYRLSQWIAPGALMQFAVGNVRYRTEALENPPQHSAPLLSGIA